MNLQKLTIISLCCILSSFSFSTANANTSFRTGLSTIDSTAKLHPSQSKSVHIFSKKRKKRFKRLVQFKYFLGKKKVKTRRKNHYGRIALLTFILSIAAILLSSITYILGPLLAISFNFLSFLAAQKGANGADEEPKLAETMFTILLALYAFVVLILSWFIVVQFL